MRLSSVLLGGLAALALMVAVPAYAEMTSMEDSDLAGIEAKGDASIDFGAYSWGDGHAGDISDHKGALDNGAAASTSITGVNSANVWGAYAGADALGPALTGTDVTSSATANAAVGGF